ncbi:MAG: hypothetical protein ACK46X_11475 [Candidatus Sericytochromatia bacterium]
MPAFAASDAVPPGLSPPRLPVASLPLTVAYFGEMGTHPGLLLGTEHTAWVAGWHRTFLSANVGGYRHPGNHVGLFLDAALGYRLNFPTGFSLESMIGMGYLHTLLDGQVYSAGPAGVEAVTDWGRPAWMPSMTVGAGIEGARLGFERTRFFTRLQLFGQYPYNAYILPHVATQVGLTWNFQ